MMANRKMLANNNKATTPFLFAALISFISCILPIYCSKTGLDIFNGVGRVTFAPGLRTYTIYDHESTTSNNQTTTTKRREKYLQRLKAGLEAERPIRKAYQSKLESLEQDLFQQKQQADVVGTSTTKKNKKMDDDEMFMDEELWEKRLNEEKRKLIEKEEYEAQVAFDRGFGSIKEEDSSLAAGNKPNPTIKFKNEYQYVGVINSPKLKIKGKQQQSSTGAGAGAASIFNNVQWYAQKKPKQSNWTLRLVHVDRAAILHQYFQKGKIDIYGEYRNTGEIDSQTGKLVVNPVYTARPRNVLTLWNLNPIKALFLERSGHKYRERRIPGGIYTDGAKVYESSYDFHYGRNGMKIIANNLANFLNETTMLSADQAEKVKRRLLVNRKSPDVVVEF